MSAGDVPHVHYCNWGVFVGFVLVFVEANSPRSFSSVFFSTVEDVEVVNAMHGRVRVQVSPTLG